MASRSHAIAGSRTRLPNLPADLFGDEFDLYADAVRRPRSQPTSPKRSVQPDNTVRRHRHVGGTVQPVRSQAPTADIVTAVSMRPPARRAATQTRLVRSRVWTWTPPVLPQPMQMLDQALPNVVTAISVAVVVLIGSVSALGIPVWAAGVFLPTVLLAVLANGVTHLAWKRASLVNIATLALVFPVLVVRQSVVRIPFVDSSNGTLYAPALATGAVILLLTLLALACAILSQEDPEFAGILFLPAAMMVPFLAGQSEIMGLSSALAIAASIFAIGAVLSVVASVLPGAFPTLVAPLTIGLEFVLLTMFRDTTIFPTGAGSAAKVLFFVVVLATAALASVLPLLSGWIRRVTRLSQSRQHA